MPVRQHVASWLTNIEVRLLFRRVAQFAQQYSAGGQTHLQFNPPTRVPTTAGGLSHLESIHLIIDLYLWLSYRFEEHFPDREDALAARAVCVSIIQEGLVLQSSKWRGKRWQKRARNMGLEIRYVWCNAIARPPLACEWVCFVCVPNTGERADSFARLVSVSMYV